MEMHEEDTIHWNEWNEIRWERDVDEERERERKSGWMGKKQQQQCEQVYEDDDDEDPTIIWTNTANASALHNYKYNSIAY